MAIIYQLGGTCQNLFVQKLFGVSVSSEIRIPAFSGDWEGLLTIVRTTQGKVRAVLPRLCDVLLNRSGEETKRHHLLWVLLRYEGTVFEEMHSDAHQFTPEFCALCFKCSMYFPFSLLCFGLCR